MEERVDTNTATLREIIGQPIFKLYVCKGNNTLVEIPYDHTLVQIAALPLSLTSGHPVVPAFIRVH